MQELEEGLQFGVYSPPYVARIWVYGDPILIYAKPYSIYLRGTVGFKPQDLGFRA